MNKMDGERQLAPTISSDGDCLRRVQEIDGSPTTFLSSCLLCFPALSHVVQDGQVQEGSESGGRAPAVPCRRRAPVLFRVGELVECQGKACLAQAARASSRRSGPKLQIKMTLNSSVHMRGCYTQIPPRNPSRTTPLVFERLGEYSSTIMAMGLRSSSFGMHFVRGTF